MTSANRSHRHGRHLHRSAVLPCRFERRAQPACRTRHATTYVVVCCSILTCLIPACLPAQQAEIKIGERRKLGKIQSPLINESSGLAPSLQHPGMYWTHNDNGRLPGLFLIDTGGQLLTRVKLESIPFRDWEDMASVQLDGTRYLVLADVGDNLCQHEIYRVHVFEEPAIDLSIKPSEHVIKTVATIEFTYPTGSSDCEAILVDAVDKKIFLISKSIDAQATTDLSMIHWIPLQTESTTVPVEATRLTSGFNQHIVSAADISTDGRMAVIRSYTTAWLFNRPASQSWCEVLAGPPELRTMLPLQRQGEAICFAHDSGSLLLTSEGLKQTIWQIDVTSPTEDR